jgi:hypothetical protein
VHCRRFGVNCWRLGAHCRRLGVYCRRFGVYCRRFGVHCRLHLHIKVTLNYQTDSLVHYQLVKPTNKTGVGRKQIPGVGSRDKWVPVTKAWRVLRLRMEERLPKWSVAAIILNKQSRTADKEWSSSLGFGRGPNNFSP